MERPFLRLTKSQQISGTGLSFSRQSFRAGIIFGLFVFWLLAFPMAGPLSATGESNGSILFFLAPHQNLDTRVIVMVNQIVGGMSEPVPTGASFPFVSA